MEYIAQHYIKVDGRMIIPGEIFRKDMDEQAEKRLMELGAIRRADTQAPASTEQPETGKLDVTDEEKDREAMREMYAAQLRLMGYGPDGMALPADDVKESTEDAEEDAPEAEPPMMDAKDTVIPAKKSAKKKTGGKAK